MMWFIISNKKQNPKLAALWWSPGYSGWFYWLTEVTLSTVHPPKLRWLVSIYLCHEGRGLKSFGSLGLDLGLFVLSNTRWKVYSWKMDLSAGWCYLTVWAMSTSISNSWSMEIKNWRNVRQTCLARWNKKTHCRGFTRDVTPVLLELSATLHVIITRTYFYMEMITVFFFPSQCWYSAAHSCPTIINDRHFSPYSSFWNRKNDQIRASNQYCNY